MEAHRFGSLVVIESRSASGHVASSQMGGDCRAVYPVDLGEVSDTGTTVIVLDQPRHL
jgi:hypothetical protein